MKTNNIVPLKNGYLTFLRDRLEITDNSNVEKILILTGFFTSSLYGLWAVLSHSDVESPITYYSGIMILLTWAFAAPYLIKRSFKHVLFYNEIGRINMMENVGGNFKARFQLKRGQIRFVQLKRNEDHFKLFLHNINQYHLKTDNMLLSA